MKPTENHASPSTALVEGGINLSVANPRHQQLHQQQPGPATSVPFNQPRSSILGTVRCGQKTAGAADNATTADSGPAGEHVGPSAEAIAAGGAEAGGQIEKGKRVGNVGGGSRGAGSLRERGPAAREKDHPASKHETGNLRGGNLRDQESSGQEGGAGTSAGVGGEVASKNGGSTLGGCARIATRAAGTSGWNHGGEVCETASESSDEGSDASEDQRSHAEGAATAAAGGGGAPLNGPELLKSLTNIQGTLSTAEGLANAALGRFRQAVGNLPPDALFAGTAALQWADKTKAEAGAMASMGRRLILSIFKDVPAKEMRAGHVEESRLVGCEQKITQALRLMLDLCDIERKCLAQERACLLLMEQGNGPSIADTATAWASALDQQGPTSAAVGPAAAIPEPTAAEPRDGQLRRGPARKACSAPTPASAGGPCSSRAAAAEPTFLSVEAQAAAAAPPPPPPLSEPSGLGPQVAAQPTGAAGPSCWAPQPSAVLPLSVAAGGEEAVAVAAEAEPIAAEPEAAPPSEFASSSHPPAPPAPAAGPSDKRAAAVPPMSKKLLRQHDRNEEKWERENLRPRQLGQAHASIQQQAQPPLSGPAAAAAAAAAAAGAQLSDLAGLLPRESLPSSAARLSGAPESPPTQHQQARVDMQPPSEAGSLNGEASRRRRRKKIRGLPEAERMLPAQASQQQLGHPASQPPHQQHQAPIAALQPQEGIHPHPFVLLTTQDEPSVVGPSSRSPPAAAAAFLFGAEASPIQSPFVASLRPGFVQPGLLEQELEQEQQPPLKRVRCHLTQPEQPQQARQQQGQQVAQLQPSLLQPAQQHQSQPPILLLPPSLLLAAQQQEQVDQQQEHQRPQERLHAPAARQRARLRPQSALELHQQLLPHATAFPHAAAIPKRQSPTPPAPPVSPGPSFTDLSGPPSHVSPLAGAGPSSTPAAAARPALEGEQQQQQRVRESRPAVDRQRAMRRSAQQRLPQQYEQQQQLQLQEPHQGEAQEQQEQHSQAEQQEQQYQQAVHQRQHHQQRKQRELEQQQQLLLLQQGQAQHRGAAGPSRLAHAGSRNVQRTPPPADAAPQVAGGNHAAAMHAANPAAAAAAAADPPVAAATAPDIATANEQAAEPADAPAVAPLPAPPALPHAVAAQPTFLDVSRDTCWEAGSRAVDEGKVMSFAHAAAKGAAATPSAAPHDAGVRVSHRAPATLHNPLCQYSGPSSTSPATNCFDAAGAWAAAPPSAPASHAGAPSPPSAAAAAAAAAAGSPPVDSPSARGSSPLLVPRRRMAAAPTMPPQAQAAAAAAAAADTRHSAGVITSAGSPPAANAPLHAQVAMISSPPLAADRDIAISSPPLAADRDMAAAAANTRPSPQTASARADDATSPASPHGSAPATPEALTERACAENATAAARAGALHSTGGSQDVPSAPACSPSLSPTVPRTGCQAARSAAAASPTQSPCLPCAGHQAACPSGSLSWGDPQCVGAAGAGASHMEERPGIPTPPLHARPLLEQPTQQHMEQAPQQREGIEPKALPMNAEARTAAPPTAAAGPQPSGKGTPANNRSPSSSTLAVGPSPHPVESHVSLLPSPPPKASPSSGKPPPTALPAPPPAPVAPTPAQPPPNLAPAQQQAVSSLAQLLAMPEEAQWQWLQSCFPVSFNEGLVVQPVPGSHPTHHKHLIHPALELLGEALFQATRRRSYEAHEVSTYIVGKQIELQFGRVETLNTLEEHMSGLAWGAHIERLKAHLKGGGTVLSFLEALATKGCKEDPAWSGYYIKDLDLYSELAHLPAARQTVQSLLSSVCPDDLLRFHFPLLGVTPTRPILYLAGYLGGVGRHVEDDGMQFINLSLPIPSIEAQGLPNAVEWYMDDSDDTQQLAKHAAKRAPKDQATKLHFCNHAKRNLDQRHAREQPTITQAPVCSDSQAQQGTGSYADLVMGNLGHAVIVAGGWCRISSNCATPSHMLKVHAPNGYKQALVEEQRQAFFRIQQGKWERKLGSPLLLTNCILSALSAPKDHLRFSPSETESFVALVLLLLLQACKDRHQLAALIQASSGEQRPASPPSHTHVAGAAAARAAAARAAAPAAPDVPKVAVVHAGAPHLTVAAGIVGTAQAGAALAGHSDASAAGNACARDLFANPDWIDAFSCRKHRQDQALCGAAAGCVGCALQRLLMQQAQQTQQQKQQQGQEQGEGEEELGQLGQQQEAAGAQDEGSMAERHPWRCKLQEQDLKDQGQEQEPERAQDNASMEEQVDRMQVEHGQRQEEHSTAQTSSGLHCTARKRGQQQPQQQGPAQPTKRTRTQRHGQAQPHKQGTSLRSMQFSKGQLGLAACWQRRLVCLRPLQEDPTAQELCDRTYWLAFPDHQCEVCGSDLELQRAVLVPPSHPLAALATPPCTVEVERMKQPARKGGKKLDEMRLQQQQQQQQLFSSQAVPPGHVLASWDAGKEQELPSKGQVRRVCLGCLMDGRHHGCRHKWLEPHVTAAVLLVRRHSLGALEEQLQVYIDDNGGAELLNRAKEDVAGML